MTHSLTSEPDKLVELRDLSVHYPAEPKPIRAVDGVHLEILPGETLALVGESGCGKSTLARALMGLERPTRGSVHFMGRELPPFPSKERRARCRDLQMVFQDPDASLNPRMTLLSAVAEALELHGTLHRSEQEKRVAQLMEQVGLDPGLRYRYPHELSGGQRQRVCIARALAVEPKLLVCDEAISALDVSVQAQILNLLAELKRELGLAYLFITHDLRVVRHVSDRVAVMYLGQVVETGETEALFEDPKHPYTQLLLQSVPPLDPDAGLGHARIEGDIPSPANPPPGCRFQTRCPRVMDRCRREQPRLYPLATGHTRCFLYEPSRVDTAVEGVSAPTTTEPG